MGKMPDFKKLLGAGIPVIAALLLNMIVYIWAAVAGFRGRVGWGFLNLLIYPITPIIYGFGIRKDLGRRAAIATLISASILAVAVGYAVRTLHAM